MAAVTVVALALAVGGVVLVLVLGAALSASATQAVTQRVQDVAAQITSDDVDAATATAGASPGDATIVQVIDDGGTVLVSSPSIAGEPAIVAPSSAGAVPTTVRLALPFADGAPYEVAIVKARNEKGLVTVVAAQSLAPVERVVHTVTVGILVAAPFLLLAVAVVTWLAVERSLASVDRITSRVEDISAADLSDRVPVPAAHDEVWRLAVTMNHMLERLERSMTRQRRFVADASHELKSPLASMRATLDVAAASGSGVDAATERVIGEEVDRLTRLVAGLLFLARGDEDAVGRFVGEVDVDDLVFAEARRLRAEGAVKAVVDVEAARIHGDAHLVAQAIRNLVDNAARFAATTVRLGVRPVPTGAEVVVEDDGPGIAPEQRDAVFDRFVRLDEHRSRADGGAGLGLAIVADIARMHDGSVEIADSDLGGARVRLMLGDARQPTGSSR